MYRRRRKTIVILVVCLTILGVVVLKVAQNEHIHRYEQHLQARVTEANVGDPTGCIVDKTTSHSYNPDAVDVDKLQTHFPIVTINTDEEIPGDVLSGGETNHRSYTKSATGEDYTIGRMKIIENGDTYNQVSDDPELVTDVEIGVRGNSSRYFDKQSYRVKLINNEGKSKDTQVMGMESNHDWVLHGPFLDKTLMRNYIGMNISGKLMSYAPDVRFCEVIVNGQYQGLYLAMETVTRGDGRADISKPDIKQNVTGYVIGLDTRSIKSNDAINTFSRYTSILHEYSYFEVSYPGADKLTDDLKQYIERDVSQFEKALYSFDYDKKRYGYTNYIDVGEFTDYMIINEVFLQHDTGKLSTYFYKDVNGRYKPCVWDFNNCLDNVSLVEKDDFFIRKFYSVQAPWFIMLVKDDQFTDRVITRYRQLRKGILSDEELLKYIDETRDYLGSAVERNYAVWGYSFDPANLDDDNKLHPDSRNPSNYNEAVEQMKKTLLERLKFLDENIEALRQYSHESAVKKYND